MSLKEIQKELESFAISVSAKKSLEKNVRKE